MASASTVRHNGHEHQGVTVNRRPLIKENANIAPHPSRAVAASRHAARGKAARAASERIAATMRSVPFQLYQADSSSLSSPIDDHDCRTHSRHGRVLAKVPKEVQGPEATKQIKYYDKCTEFRACELGRDTLSQCHTLATTRGGKVWIQPHGEERKEEDGRLNKRIRQCSVTRQSLQARLLAQVARKLAKKTQDSVNANFLGSGLKPHTLEKLSLEEEQTRHFLGRIRAAVATAPDSGMTFADGKQVWSEQEAVAHSLYSRRLQMVEAEVASLREDKEHLARVIQHLRSTNQQLERDVIHQLPALVNKAITLENNLLLRGKAAAGQWPEENAKKANPKPGSASTDPLLLRATHHSPDEGETDKSPEKSKDTAAERARETGLSEALSQGYAFGYVAGDDVPPSTSREAQTQGGGARRSVVEAQIEQESEALKRKDANRKEKKKEEEEAPHHRILVAGTHRLRVNSYAATPALAECEEIVSDTSDSLKHHLNACLNDLARRVQRMGMAEQDAEDMPQPDAEELADDNSGSVSSSTSCTMPKQHECLPVFRDQVLGAHASMEQGQQAYVQGGRVAGMGKEACWVRDRPALPSLLPTHLPFEARGTESGGGPVVSMEGEEEEECLSRAKRLLAFLKGGAVGV